MKGCRSLRQAQVLFDDVGLAGVLEEGNNVHPELRPVDRLGVGVVVELADLEQVDKRSCLADHVQNLGGVQDRLEADPSPDPGLVCFPEVFDAYFGERRARLPVQRSFSVAAGERDRKRRARDGLEDVKVSPGQRSALGEDGRVELVLFEDEQRFPRDLVTLLCGLVDVGREAKQDVPVIARELLRVLLRLRQDVWPWPDVVRAVELLARRERGRRSKAVGAAVAAPLVEVEGKGRVLERLASGLVNRGHDVLLWGDGGAAPSVVDGEKIAPPKLFGKKSEQKQ